MRGNHGPCLQNLKYSGVDVLSHLPIKASTCLQIKNGLRDLQSEWAWPRSHPPLPPNPQSSPSSVADRFVGGRRVRRTSSHCSKAHRWIPFLQSTQAFGNVSQIRWRGSEHSAIPVP